MLHSQPCDAWTHVLDLGTVDGEVVNLHDKDR